MAARGARDRVLEASPLHVRIVVQEVVRRGGHAIEVDVVEPLAERLGAGADLGLGQLHGHDASCTVARTSLASVVGSTVERIMIPIQPHGCCL